MRALLASPLGFLIGASLGALGGGGSILAVPLLVHVAGQDPKAATASSLVLVALASIVGLVPHARAGRVRFPQGLTFALVGVVGTVGGSRLNAAVDGDVLLLAFSVVILAAAALMARSPRARPRPRRSTRAVGAAVRRAERRSDAPAPGTAPETPGTPARPLGQTAVRVALAGTGVGLLTGFFGVGGGFVTVPALVLVLGYAMPQAVGTSILVILVNSLVALAVRLGDGAIDWAVVLPFALSSMAGVLAGARLADRVDPSGLQLWFAGVLVAVAAYTAVDAIVALA